MLSNTLKFKCYPPGWWNVLFWIWIINCGGLCIIFIEYSRGCSLLPSSFKLGWVNYKNNFWKLDQGWKVFFWIKWLIWTILDVLNSVLFVLNRGKCLKFFITKCWPLIIMKARLLGSIISAALYIAPPWNCGCWLHTFTNFHFIRLSWGS